MGRRGSLEHDRTGLLHARRRGARRSPPPTSRSSACSRSSRPSAARAARERSAELRGLLAEIAREHGINRALMRQELTFLSHLTRLVGGEPEPAYRPAPTAADRRGGGAPPLHRVLDLQA